MTLRAPTVLLTAVLAVGATLPSPAGAAPPERYLDPVFANVTVTRDLTYGTAPDEDGVTQSLELDLFEPTGDTLGARPVVILAHGGGFVNGSKEGMAGLATAYARRGFVAASIEYRMDEGAGAIGFPPSTAQIGRILAAKHDMQAAVRWARAQAGTHRLDADKVAVGGSSAGAVMAVLTATMPDDPGTSGTPGPSSAVCTAVSLAGAGDPALVGPGDAGAIFFHGDQDRTVPYSQAAATHEAMAEAGLATELVTFPGVGHGLPGGGQIEEQSSAWMKEHVVDRTTSCAGPVDPADVAFVQAAYADLIGRAPSDAERAQEAGRLGAGASRASLLARLTTSDEWLGGIVTDLYADTLGRAPDAEGLEFWVRTLRTGRLSVARVTASFLAAGEYYARAGGTDASWVEALYGQVLGRAGSPDDVAYWVAATRREGRTWVAVRIHGSLESRQDRVSALYQLLLGRAPEPDGLAFWAARVARTGDLALARSLAASPEYGARAVTRFPA